MENRIVKRVTAIIFLVFIFGMSGMYLRKFPSLWRNIIESRTGVKDTVHEVENFYTNQIPARWNFIEFYGAVQKILGKKSIEDFTLVKTDYGKIEQLQREMTKEERETFADNIRVISEYTSAREIPMFYLTSILPVVEPSDLPVGIKEYSHENASALLEEMEKRNVPIIDLRKSEDIQKIGKEELFYRTDHHWSVKTCFLAYRYTISEVNKRLDWSLDSGDIYTNLENYSVLKKENSFLGSYGVKVGQYYAGKDDFTAYIPRFDTCLEFESYDGEHNLQDERKGCFEDVFLSLDLVENEDYFNKYNAFLRGSSIETRVVNWMAENELKVLLISHSYGRPFTQYLSLCFRETRYLDPQKGRYNDNCLKYIDEYGPDLVLVMTEFEGKGVEIETDDKR